MKRNLFAAIAAGLLASAAPIPLPSLPSFSLAVPQAKAQSAVVLENLVFKGDLTEVRIPRITVEGTTATKAEIEALFDAKALNQLGERLSRISARSVSIPLIELTQNTPEMTATTTYRDTVMRDIRNGRISEMSTPVATSKATPKQAANAAMLFDMDMANMVLKEADLPLMLRFVYDKAAAGETLKAATVEQTIGKISYRIGGVASVTIDSASIKDFKLKPLETPFIDLVGTMQKNAARKTPETEKASALAVVSIMTSMSYGNMEMNGLKGEAISPADKTPVKFAIGKISGAGGGEVQGRFSLQGLSVETGPSKVNLGEFTLQGLDMSNLWTALRTAAAKPDFNTGDFDPAAAIPRLTLLRVAGIDINVPDPKAAGQMIKAKLGRFETRMGNHVGPIPTNIGINLDGFQLDIPPDTRENGLKDILALGYKALDISMSYEQLWDEAKKTLTVKDLSLRSAGMVKAAASAEVVNVPREVFTFDKAKAAVAALGIAARSVQIALANEGLVEKLLQQQATQQKRKVDDVRAEMAAGAALIVPMMMGDHPGARAVGAALGKFIADPKSINVTLKAKGDGVGAMDFLASSNPMDVLKKVDITAGANP